MNDIDAVAVAIARADSGYVSADNYWAMAKAAIEAMGGYGDGVALSRVVAHNQRKASAGPRVAPDLTAGDEAACAATKAAIAASNARYPVGSQEAHDAAKIERAWDEAEARRAEKYALIA